MKNSDRVNHFVNTVNAGYARRSVYNTTNKIASAYPIKDKKRTGRPNSWTTTDRKKKTEEISQYPKKSQSSKTFKKNFCYTARYQFSIIKKGYQ